MRLFKLLLLLFVIVALGLPVCKCKYLSDAPNFSTGASYDIKYARCEWTVDPAIQFINGVVTYYFIPAQGNLLYLELDLTQALTVDSMLFHLVPVNFNQLNSDRLRVNFISGLPAGVLDSITICYHGVPPVSGQGSFMTDVHTTGPVLWTLSEPYGAKDWWPCHQDLNDKIDSIDVFVTAPEQYRVAGNGSLVSEIISGNSKVTHWQSHYPVAAYLVAIAVTNYAAFSEYVPLPNGDSLLLLNYVFPEDSANAQATMPSFIRVLQYYDSLLIPYPFAAEKYGHAQFGWGGGMEHQTMSFIGQFDAILMAHECAHQWFGDQITCGSWEDIWLNEGFATYFEGMAEDYLYPGSWHNWVGFLADQATSKPDGSVFCTDTSNISRIFNGRLSYRKGAYLLNMLRWELGDSVFFNAVRNYLVDPVVSYSYANTSDFKRNLEQSSGKDLTLFFNQWYYGQGYPTYEVDWSQSGNTVNVKILQSTSDTSVSFYQMPVQIEFRNGNRDTLIVFQHTYSGQTFSVTLDFQVADVFFDPNLWILSRGNVVFSEDDYNSALEQIEIFPNPGTGELNFKVRHSPLAVEEVRMYDADGALVMDIQFQGKILKQTIDTEILPQGIYFVKFLTDRGVICKKFMRMK